MPTFTNSIGTFTAVGIGVRPPTVALDVVGDFNLTGDAVIAAHVSVGTTATVAQLEVESDDDHQCMILKQDAGQTANPLEVQDSDGNNVFVVDPQGNVTMSNQIQQDLKLILKNTIGAAGSDTSNVQVWGQNSAKFTGHNNGGSQLFNMGYDSNAGSVAVIGYGGGSAFRFNSSHQACCARSRHDFNGQLCVTGNSTNTAIDLLVLKRRASGDTGDLLRWTDESDVALGTIDKDGNVGIGTDTPAAALDVVGGNIRSITTKIADYTVTENDYTILADSSSTAVTITLPAAPNEGQVFYIKAIDVTNGVTVDPNTNNIDGSASTASLALYDTLMVQADANGDYWIL